MLSGAPGDRVARVPRAAISVRPGIPGTIETPGTRIDVGCAGIREALAQAHSARSACSVWRVGVCSRAGWGRGGGNPRVTADGEAACGEHRHRATDEARKPTGRITATAARGGLGSSPFPPRGGARGEVAGRGRRSWRRTAHARSSVGAACGCALHVGTSRDDPREAAAAVSREAWPGPAQACLAESRRARRTRPDRSSSRAAPSCRPRRSRWPRAASPSSRRRDRSP